MKGKKHWVLWNSCNAILTHNCSTILNLSICCKKLLRTFFAQKLYHNRNLYSLYPPYRSTMIVLLQTQATSKEQNLLYRYQRFCLLLSLSSLLLRMRRKKRIKECKEREQKQYRKKNERKCERQTERKQTIIAGAMWRYMNNMLITIEIVTYLSSPKTYTLWHSIKIMVYFILIKYALFSHCYLSS